MESILAATVTGVLTLIGVLISNMKSKAVLELPLLPSRSMLGQRRGKRKTRGEALATKGKMSD